jgi:dolichyl-phosphate beta-glucosyltransferase
MNHDVQMLVGSRAIHPRGYEGYTLIRKITSKTYIRVLSLLTGLKTTDSQCGFKMFTRDTARSIFSLAETNGWAFDLELFLLAKREDAVIAEMPVSIVNHRESRISVLRDSPRMLREILRIKKRVKALK